MNIDENLLKLKAKIESAKEDLYSASKEDVLEKFMRVYSLNEVYDAITGKDVFTIADFVKHDEEMAIHLVGELNSKKNDLIKEERIKTRGELFLSNPILTDTATLLNGYYKDLTSSLVLPKGNYRQDYIDRRIIDLPERHISSSDMENIVNDFMSEIAPQHKNLFTEMKEDGRLFLLDHNIRRIANYGGGFNGANFNHGIIDDSVVIGVANNDLERLGTIAHEFGHEVELLDLRKNASPEEFFDYRLRSQYGEMKSSTYTLMMYDFLGKIGYPEEELRSLRTYELLRGRVAANRMMENVYGNNANFLENYNHDLEYTYGIIAAVYFNSLDFDEYNKKMDIFDKEKVSLHNLEILKKIGCNSNEFDRAFTKCLTKCK